MAHLHFIGIKPFIILAFRIFNCVMMRIIGLDQNLSFFIRTTSRPATWVNSWKVRSDERKSGKFRAVSAFRTPTSVTLGKSKPLAIIWVPSRISACHFQKSLGASREPLFYVSYQHPYESLWLLAKVPSIGHKPSVSQSHNSESDGSDS